MSEHDEQGEPHVHAFSLSIPAGLVEAQDRSAMERTSRYQRIYRFLDGLDVDGLLALRDVLNHDPKSALNNYFDGMAVTMLRLVHGVDPDSGLTPQEAIEQAGSGA